MQNQIILNSNLLKLYTDSARNNTGKGLSIHSLGQWLKVQTKNEFIVIRRDFVISLMEGITITKDINSSQAILARYDFEEMRKWL